MMTALIFGTLGFYGPSAPTIKLGDFIVQRAVQQQLYFSADVRNEIELRWLARFQGHDHLDSNGRKRGAAGFPGTYSSAFSKLTTPYADYLSALGSAPDEVIEFQVMVPRRRQSARERANPYLAEPEPEFSSETIRPKVLLGRLLGVADVMVDTWSFHFGQLEKDDNARVAADRVSANELPSSKMLRDAELAVGGETVYERYTEGEPMPLYECDRRACDRMATLRALTWLVEEVKELTPAMAFLCGYIRCEAAVDEDDEADERGLDERVMARRQARREKREARHVGGDDAAKGAAAREAALAFLAEFSEEWVPRLSQGDERSALQKGTIRPPPGMKEVRPDGAGADADACMEELWAYGTDSPWRFRGGELVLPALMGVRLRELRAAAAAEARAELQNEILPQIDYARTTYTGLAKPVWTRLDTIDYDQ
tara:strand:- start:381 stop:1664 length:1284 start_codon:yes stop_codon:yes gene_type:complete